MWAWPLLWFWCGGVAVAWCDVCGSRTPYATKALHSLQPAAAVMPILPTARVAGSGYLPPPRCRRQS